MAAPVSQLKVGAVLGYASLLLGNLVAIFVTPFMLRTLGQSEFGLYSLIGTFVGYLTVLDLGLNNSIVRYVARYRASSDNAGEQNFLAMAMITYGGIALLAAAVGAMLWWRLDLIFGGALTAKELDRARIMFAILVLNVVVALPAGGVTAILCGYERFSYTRALDLVRLAVRTGLLVALLSVGYKAVGIIVLDTALNLTLAVLNGAYVFRRLGVRLVLHHLDSKLVYEVFSYSSWMVLWLVFGQLFTRIGQVVLGVTDGTSAVALYAVAAMLVSYYGSFAYVVSSMLLPQATRLVVQNAGGYQLTDFMIRIGRLQFLVLSYLLGAFILFGQAFVTLWAGSAYGRAWLVALVVMLPQTVSITRDVGVAIQQAQNRIVFRAFYLAMMVVLAVGFGLAGQRWFDGPLAMGVGLMLTTILGNGIMDLYYSRVIGIDMIRFYREVVGARLGALLVVLVVGYGLARLAPVSGWRMLITQGVIYTVVFGAVTWRLGMNLFELELFRSLASTVAQRIRTCATLP
jgi:O-antigen/teichoic acid export membrane protein